MTAKPSRLRAWLVRLRWWLGVPLLLVLLYALFGYLALPRIARALATDYVEQRLGRQLAIGEIAFDPFRFEARISALQLSEADGTPLLGFDALRLNADPLVSLFRRTITIGELTLTRPDISLIVEADGSVNLAKLVPPASEPAPAETTPQPLPSVYLRHFAVSDGRLALQDRSRPQPFAMELTPIHFELAEFRTEAAHDNRYRFSASTGAGETLEWTGGFSLQPFGSEGEFKLGKLQLATVGGYLQDMLPLRLADGSVDLAGHYRLLLVPTLALQVELPSLQLHSLALAELKGKAPPPVTVAETRIESLRFSLEQREIAVGAVRLDGAVIDLRREADGSLNLLRLTPPAKSSGKPAPKGDAASEAAWKFSVGQLQIADSRVRVEDRTVQPATRFTLAPLRLRVDGISSAADARLKLAAELAINDKARLSADGSVQLQPLTADVALELRNFALPAVQPYLTPLTGVRLRSGALGVKGRVRYGEQARPQLGFDGELQLSDLAATDRIGKEDFARFKRIEVSGIALTQQPDRLVIERVTLSQPYARIVIAADRKLNLAEIAAPPASAKLATKTPPPASAAKTQAAAPAMPVSVKTIRIEQGSAYFADQSIEPSFAAGIEALGGDISGVSTDPAARTRIALKGQVGRYSPVEISGSTRPLDATRDTDLKLSFRNMELSTFNPYSGKFAGYNIAKGKLTTELHYRLDQNTLVAEHHVIVDQLEFGEATGSKDAAPLPIKLAVALLKDRHGVIDLQLPVSGRLDDPQFRYGEIVRQVLWNNLGKIISAPFAALGKLFGGGEELAYLDFPAGSAELGDSQRSKLDKLREALGERPQLKLDVPITRSAADAEALAQQAVAARVPALATDEQSRLNAIERAYRELYGSAIRYPNGTDTPAARLAFVEPAVRGRLAPDEAALDTLARARAEAVQAALLATPAITPERIFVTSGRAGGEGDNGAVRMELKLE